ncbi:MAG TPA: LysR family transcriptional regulator, partial [Actinomycetaceae bacterium]|nr:LysR family transcriptional regulator [Actinomycetaceae bacterium]
MDIRQLHYAVLLAEHAHFGRAAAAAHISQSALSQQIARLERRLATKLFDRATTPLTLTEAGDTFIPQAMEILGRVRALEREVSALARSLTGRLRLGIFGAGAGELTATLVSGFRRAAPEVTLEFVELTMANQITALEQEIVDVALLHLPFDAPHLEFVPLFTEPRYATLPHDHPLAERPAISLADLHGDEFVAHRSSVPRPWAQYWSCAGDDGRSGATSGISSLTEGLHAVAYGQLVDTAPASGTRFFRHPGVCFVRLLDATPATAAVAGRRNCANPNTRRFLTLARELARSSRDLITALEQPAP